MSRRIPLARPALAAVAVTLAVAGPAQAAPQWLASQALGLSDVNAPVLAMGAGGAVVGAYAPTTGDPQIAVTYKAPGAPAAIARPASGLASVGALRAAVDAAGDAVVVFTATDAAGADPTRAHVYALTRRAGATSWAGPIQVSPDGATGASPDVALDPAGNAVVVWAADSYQGAVNSRYLAANGTLEAVQSLANADASPMTGRPRVALDGQGRATVVAVFEGASTFVRAAQRAAGAQGAWTAAALLQTSEAAYPYPGDAGVAVNAAGDALVWWQLRSAGYAHVVRGAYHARSAAANAFGAVADIGADPYGINRTSVSVPAGGGALALVNGDSARLTRLFDPVTGTWSDAAGAGSWTSATTRSVPAFAFAPDGTAVAAWSQSPSGTAPAVVRVARRAPGGAWAELAPATSHTGSDTATDVTPLGVGIDDEGNVAAAWNRDAGTSRESHVGLYDAGAPAGSATVPSSADVGSAAGMTASFADRMSATAISWDFGDGTAAATGASVSHVYARPGSFTVKATATDAAGNATTVTRTLVANDVTAPETAIAGPSLTNRDPVPAVISGTDNVTAAADLTFACTLDGTPVSCVGGLSGIGEGAHTLTAAATDAAGNTDPTPASYAFTVDRTAPGLTFGAPGDVTEGSGSRVVLSGIGGRASGDGASVRWTVWAGEPGASAALQQGTAPVAGGGAWSVTLAELPAGSYSARAEQSDAAGNAASRVVRFRVLSAPAPEKPVADPPAPAPSGAGSPPAPPAAAPEDPPSQPTASIATLVAQSQSALTSLLSTQGTAALGKPLGVEVGVDQPGRMLGQLTLAGAGGRTAVASRRARVLSQGAMTFAAAGAGTLRLKPTRLGRALARRRKPLKVLVTLTFRPAAGGPASVRRTTMTIKRRKR